MALAPPATPTSVDDLQVRLEAPLPDDVRRVLTGFAGGVAMSWSLPDDVHAPELPETTWGGCRFDMESLYRAEVARRGWVVNCFSNQNDSYDVVWHEKLGLIEVPNGDVIAADVSRAPAPIVYLSHDDGDGHGCVLGSDFIDFLDRWTRIGCPGPEDWTWLPFYDRSVGAIDPDSAVAVRWRRWLALPW